MPQKKNPDIAELVRGKDRTRVWSPCFHIDNHERNSGLHANKDMQGR